MRFVEDMVSYDIARYDGFPVGKENDLISYVLTFSASGIV